MEALDKESLVLVEKSSESKEGAFNLTDKEEIVVQDEVTATEDDGVTEWDTESVVTLRGSDEDFTFGDDNLVGEYRVDGECS